MFKSPISKMKTKFKKHKGLFIAALMLEILSIPAAAQIVDRVSFSAPQKVASVKLDVEQDGLQRFVVASNGPFAIISENTSGEFNIRLRTKGDINGHLIGTNAQLPGSGEGCALTKANSGAQKIYESVRKTAKARGDVLSQAVIIDIKYDPSLSPNFKIITQKNALSIQAADRCAIA